MKRVSRFATLLAGALLPATTAALAAPFNTGDVVVAVGEGRYAHYSRDGVLLETLDQGEGGLASACAFDASGRLFTTNFVTNKVVVFDPNPPHPIVQIIETGLDYGEGAESIAFADNGDFYLGYALGDKDILRYNAAGTFQQAYDVPIEDQGSDFIELSSDQRTIFYTSEGGTILRYDTVAGTALTAFATPGGENFALRLLPPGDGSGGLLVAHFSSVLRLDGAGAVVQTYDAPDEDSWFQVRLDPGATSFWAAGLNSGNLYRFNLATGAVEAGPIRTPGAPGTLAGLGVKGEVTAGNQCPQFDSPPSPLEGAVISLCLGDQVDFMVQVSDPNPDDVVTLSGSSTARGWTFSPAPQNPVSGHFSWTPTADHVGSNVITFNATDGKCVVSRNVTINVNPSNCPDTPVFWRTHDFRWPVRSLTLGTVSYRQSELLALLQGVTDGGHTERSRRLARQLVAAKLNLAICAGVPAAIQTIADADAMIGPRRVPFEVLENSPEGRLIESAIKSLDDFNKGKLSPDCPRDQSTDEEPAVGFDRALEFGLSRGDPNPFAASTRLGFALPQAARVRLSVLDVQGREVRLLADTKLESGRHGATWDGTDAAGHRLPNGIYFIRIAAVGREIVNSIVLMR